MQNILDLQKISLENNSDDTRDFSPSISTISVIGLSTVSNDC